MTCVRRCDFFSLAPGELGVLLNRFPAVTEISLGIMDGLTDVELQDVAKCQHLQKLYITSCNNVSLAGLLSLCLLCPSLSCVECRHCAQLKSPILEVCKQLLSKHGKVITTLYG